MNAPRRTIEKRDKIIRAYWGRETARQIGDRVGMRADSVSKRAKVLGLPPGAGYQPPLPTEEKMGNDAETASRRFKAAYEAVAAKYGWRVRDYR